MEKCVFPGCDGEAGKDVIESRKAWCKVHERAQCVYGLNVKGAVSGESKCKELTLPGSGWCREHDEMVVFFDFLHNLRHIEAAQQAQQIRIPQRLLAPNGRPLDLRAL